MPTRILLTIEYAGSDFHGWQIQQADPAGSSNRTFRTVQGEIEEALKKLTGAEIRIAGASRTDVGVHAVGQTATFDWPETPLIPSEKLPKALNAHLPIDVSVSAAKVVPENFHAQHNAKGKIYRYAVFSRRLRSPRVHRTHWTVRYALNAQAMQQAANHLVGTQDLSAFATELDIIQDRRVQSGMVPLETVRTLHRVDVMESPFDPAQDPQISGSEMFIEVEGSGFLYKMVRTIVGTLVEVGRGKQEPDWIKEVLASKDRRNAGPTAPAKGLCLMQVLY